MPSHVLAANRFAALRSDSEEEGEDGEAKPRRKVKKGIKRKAGKLKSKQEALTPEDPVLGATDAEADAAGAFDPSAGTAQLRRKRKRRPSATAERLSEGTATARSEMTEEARVDTKHDPGTLLPLGATKTLPGGVVIKVLRAAPFGAPVALKGSEVRLIYEGRLAKNQRRFDNGEIDFLLGDVGILVRDEDG
ncbi:unnamed protein product [Durusdinium trenchii]|uniref:Peptidylprolyl isomerase n=1 Tax=Durusdinium trenchii TaxID=1381693 RepID=A0ABP0PPY2_9DINO